MRRLRKTAGIVEELSLNVATLLEPNPAKRSPEAKGSRTHTDVVMFDQKSKDVIACIECKSCITPDLFRRTKPNANFQRLKDDTAKYSQNDYSPLYIIMWTIHWDVLDMDTDSEVNQCKYYFNHHRMHQLGFSLTDIKKDIKRTFHEVELGRVIHQCTINSDDEWHNSRATVIATLARMVGVNFVKLSLRDLWE